MHTLYHDPQHHGAVDASIFWILGACPLLAGTDTLTNGLGIIFAALAAAVLGPALAATLFARLHEPLRITACVLAVGTLVSALTLISNAWLPSLHATLGIFPSLIATNLLLISFMRQAPGTGMVDAIRTSLASFTPVLVVLLILSTLRELVGRGSLLHDVDLVARWLPRGLDVQLFSADLGFLLGLLPPGAFIAFAVLLAGRNWLRMRASTTT